MSYTDAMLNGHEMTRRQALGALGAVGVTAMAGALASPREATAQAFDVQESVQDGLKRLFGNRPIKDGSAAVKLDVPLIAENGALVQVGVEAESPMTPANHVKHIYIVADKNRIPIVARATLSPESGRAYAFTTIRLGETTDVRAIVEQSDGILLATRREVKVTVGGCGG